MWSSLIPIKMWSSLKNKPMNGIDVSHHNGNIDWNAVASNIPKVDFAFIKCSEGSSGKDNKFATNVAGCIANGIKWGAYHFATWNMKPVEKDAVQEAQWFVSVVKTVGKPDLPLVLDIESNTPIPYTKEEMVAYVKAFTDEIKKAGYDVVIYSFPGFLNSYLPSNHPFTNIPLWLADFSGPINPVPGWTKIWLHQYSEKGSINGITGNVDLNKQVDI